MSGLSIAVIAHKRPRYLYVALDSIFYATGIEEVDVHVCCDGGLRMDIREEMANTAFRHPIKSFTVYKEQRGCLINVLDAIQNAFKPGVQEVLYIESDMIIRPDTLEHLKGIERDTAFYNLVWAHDTKACVYTPGVNLVSRESFGNLAEWIRRKGHIGTIRPIYDTPITEETTSHDGVFYSYMKVHNLETRYPEIPYAAHFGLHGMNHGLNEVELEFENYMFSGPHDSWLPRIARIIEREEEIPAEVKAELFFPDNFRYPVPSLLKNTLMYIDE